VDKSLVRVRDEGRFWMLETIREFARERLAASGEEGEIRDRLAAHFLELGVEAAPHLRRHDRAWVDRLEAEHDNFRAALDHLEDRGAWQQVLRLGAALAEFWSGHGHLAEGLRHLEAALAADDEPTPARAAALHRAADIAYGTGDNDHSRVRAEAALDLSRRLGLTWDEAASVAILGGIADDEGDSARARELWQESARLFRESGDESDALFCDRLVAWMHAQLGEYERSVALYDETLQRARELGDPYVQAQCLDGLGSRAVAERRLDEAAEMFEEAYDLYVGLDDRYRVSLNVARFASVLAAYGRPVGAARALAAAETQLDEMGAHPAWAAALNDETRASIRAQLDDEELAEAWRTGEALDIESAAARARHELREARDED
jgi:hypothetical protein